MSKTSNPDRRQRRDRRERAPSEYEETTLSVDRVTRVVKGGRRMRFRAVVIVGNKKGKVGLGTGKANEVQAAVQKAVKAAKQDMVRIPLIKGTIPHDVDVKHKAARIRLMPASEGTGIIAGGALRVILDHAGIKDVLAKRFGTRNKLVNAQAAIEALRMLSGVNVKNADTFTDEKKEENDAEESESTLKVRSISKKNVTRDGTLKDDTKA